VSDTRGVRFACPPDMLSPFVNERQARLAVPYLAGLSRSWNLGFRASAALGDMSRPFPTLENITESPVAATFYITFGAHVRPVHTIHSPRWALEQFTNRPRGPEVGGARPASWLSAPASPALGRQEAVVPFARATRGDAAPPRIEDRRSLQNLRKKKRCELRRLPLSLPLPPEVTTSPGSLGANPAGPAEQASFLSP
jgi:hypothetical protein